MGVCSTKHSRSPAAQISEPRAAPIILDSSNLRSVVMNVTVQAAKNNTNDGQVATIKQMLSEHFPATVFQYVPVANSTEKHFILICDGKLIHSSEYDGSIQARKDQVYQEISTMAKNKLASQF